MCPWIFPIQNPWPYPYLVSRDRVRINEIMLPTPCYPLCCLFRESSFSWFGLILALGDILAVSLYSRLLGALGNEPQSNISLTDTVGKVKYHLHPQIKRKCPLKSLVVLTYACHCFIYVNQVDQSGLRYAVCSCSVVSNSLWPHGLQPARLLCPWGFSRQEYWGGMSCPPPGDFPKPGTEPRSPALQADSLPSVLPAKPMNTVVGQSEISQRCPTLCSHTDYTVHGILQSRVLEWIALPFSRGSSQPRDWTQVSCIAGGFFTSWATREAQKYWSG